MAISSRKSSGQVLRSLSPSGRYSGTSSSAVFASSSSSFRSTNFFHNQSREASPTRVNLRRVSSVRFSPNRSLAVAPKSQSQSQSQGGHHHQKKTCLCSPTNHPGSFRCSFHKKSAAAAAAASSSSSSSYSPPNRLNARRSAMTNSLVRIGGVEGGDLVRRALAALIRPSSHQQRRRGSFQARPSRLSIMSNSNSNSESDSESNS